jgi:hypothetical protein
VPDKKMGQWWNDTDRGKPKNLEKNLSQCATLFTTNPTWTGPGANPDLHGEKPVTNRLSHGKDMYIITSLKCPIHFIIFSSKSLFTYMLHVSHFSTFKDYTYEFQSKEGLFPQSALTD